MPSPFSLAAFDPVLVTPPDADISNYTTLAPIPPPGSLEEMDNMDGKPVQQESVAESIMRMTPAKSRADAGLAIEMFESSPQSTDPSARLFVREETFNKVRNLKRMSENARRAALSREFEGKEVELHKMQTPDLCVALLQAVDGLADEVLQAYLAHTRFVVDIWANYDSVDKELYLRED